MSASVLFHDKTKIIVSVPSSWSDGQIEAFAGPGWEIIREGDSRLSGAPERVAAPDAWGKCWVTLARSQP